MKLVKLAALGIAIILIQAFKHPIEIEGVGDVISLSGTRGCTYEDVTATPVPDNCTKNTVLSKVKNATGKTVRVHYQETYTAVPRAGWQFESWVNCEGLAEASSDTCTFNIPSTTAIERAEEREDIPPLKAVFTPVDADGDGVVSASDLCPGTASGETVNSDGCAATQDGWCFRCE